MSIFAVTSGKGGVGKSSVAAYTAAAFAAQGKRTLLIELGDDPRMLDIIVGTGREILFDISDVIDGRCKPSDAIQQSCIDDKLFLLPGSLGVLESAPKTEIIESIISGSASYYDHIVMDGLCFETVSPALADAVVIVTTPDSLSVRACSAYAQGLRSRGVKGMRLVINAVPAKITPMLDLQDFDSIVDQIGAQLLGVIPYSPILQYCSNNTEPLAADSMTADVFENIAVRLLGQNRPLLVR